MSTLLEPGEIEAAASSPPFLYLPPSNLFTLRAERLQMLAEGNGLGDYLRFAAALCRVQQDLFDHPPLTLARVAGPAPLAAESLVRDDAWQSWLDALLRGFQAQTSEQQAAMDTLSSANAGQRKVWALELLSGQYGLVPAALVPFLGAALQAAWSHALLALGEADVKPAHTLAQCPACGSPAMAGVIRHRGRHNGLRYLLCSLCACEWHVVRVKCVYCEQSKGLLYYSFEDDRHASGKAPLQAECCPGCSSYLKQVYLENDASAEGLSADLASLALDMRLDGEGYQRLAPNLLLAPGGE
ncbi:formate dehydrogenase accessory protein FdhE [Pseudomonas fontis]|uniref:Protein FdhE homolog n=1 Tax=Pseudomonas fontis TaxID=2942633 RepID=A0ABT5NW83_9PSED|nr:formate dehydrogenase accessory protein FdhE [Pseudomonas fontis]MDD0975662.1 formate dehydrogenase accessory protein FdhE [Pseudomonas fontis]MDD0992438.1 formate dehydrogenase accessory protein FdhE [Pseudomonas fontis]